MGVVQKIKFFLINILRIYRGTRAIADRECPICGYIGKFGVQMRPLLVDAICAKCGSSGRHRHFFLLVSKDIVRLKEPIFHFAAESCLSNFFTKRFRSYRRVGLLGPDLVIDIEDINVDAGSLGSVIAHQVLEHVNDGKALVQIRNALKAGGMFCFTTPIIESWQETFEDHGVRDSRERILFFGQSDHLRYYGRDIRQKLLSLGFIVTEFVASEPEVSRFALERGETIFVCYKP